MTLEDSFARVMKYHPLDVCKKLTISKNGIDAGYMAKSVLPSVTPTSLLVSSYSSS
jgi:hypothetical protein